LEESEEGGAEEEEWTARWRGLVERRLGMEGAARVRVVERRRGKRREETMFVCRERMVVEGKKEGWKCRAPLSSAKPTE